MNWLNIHTDTLRSEEYLGADPVQRATWLNLLAWCVSQENGGIIEGASEWGERKWLQLCGITQAESAIPSKLYAIDHEGRMAVAFYPTEKEDEVKVKREAGKRGGKAKSEAKAAAAKLNGAKGGRPATQAPAEAEPKQNPSRNPREGKGREGKGKELPPAPRGGACVETLDQQASRIWKAYPKSGRTRSSQKQLKDSWAKCQDRPTIDEALTALEGWKLCEQWQKEGGQFIQGAHLWVTNRKWEDIPPPWNPNENKTHGNRPNRNTGTALGRAGGQKRTTPLPDAP